MSSQELLEERFEHLRHWHGHFGFRIGALAAIQSRNGIESEVIPDLFAAFELHVGELREAKLLALEARDDSDLATSRIAIERGVGAVIALLDKLQAQKEGGFSEEISAKETAREALAGWVDEVEGAYGWIRDAEIGD